MFELKYDTPFEWTEAVLCDFDSFLQDHASAEKKASGMATSMLSHYPDRETLVRTMTDLAIEELFHFKEVLKLLTSKGLTLGNDKKDSYIKQMRGVFRGDPLQFFLDRLLLGAVIEARGCERFALVGEALPEGKEKQFYIEIAASEEKHKNLFVELAYEYFEKEEVDLRLEEILIYEAKVCESLPHRAALH